MTNQPTAAALHPHLTHTVTLHLGNASLPGIETRSYTRIIPRQRGFSADAHPHKHPPHEQSGLGEHFQNTQLVWVDDSRTLIPIDQPKILTDHLRTFLAADT